MYLQKQKFGYFIFQFLKHSCMLDIEIFDGIVTLKTFNIA